jgi:hypothetical protein
MDQRNFEFMFYGLASALLVLGVYTVYLASREDKIGQEIRRLKMLIEDRERR